MFRCGGNKNEVLKQCVNKDLHHTFTSSREFLLLIHFIFELHHSIINCKAEQVILGGTLENSEKVPRNASCAPQYDIMLRGKCCFATYYNSKHLLKPRANLSLAFQIFNIFFPSNPKIELKQVSMYISIQFTKKRERI